VQVFGTQPPPPSSALQLPILNLPSLGQLDFDVLAPHSANSSSSRWQCRNLRLKKFSTPSPFVLPFSSPLSSRPRCNNCLYFSRKTSPFKQLWQQNFPNFQPHFADCFSAPHPTRKDFAKERKTMCTTASLNTHLLLTDSRHAHNTSALPTSIRPRRTNPSAPLSVYLTNCCEERKERDKDKA
jgi:hypothetical protein